MKTRRIQNNKWGAVAVEFAMTLPILLLLVFAGVELGRTSMLRHTADHAAYLAARDAIVPGADAASVRQKAIDHLEIHGVSDYVVTVTPNNIEAATSKVNVEVSFPISSNSIVIPEYFTGQVNGKCLLVTERPPAEMAVSIPSPPPPPAPPVVTIPNWDDDDDDDDVPYVPSPSPSPSPSPTPAPAPPPPPSL